MVNPIQLTNPTAYSGGADFTPLANLGEIYKKAQNEARLTELGKQLAAGSTDYRSAAGQLAEMGDTASMLKFIALAEQQRKEQLGLEASKAFGGGLLAPLLSGGNAGARPSAAETIIDAPSAKVAAPQLVPNPAADDPTAPIRTLPDGRIAGNITSPMVPLGTPAEAPATFADRFQAARRSGVAPAGAAAPPTPAVATDEETAAATAPAVVAKPRAPLEATRLPGEPDFMAAVPGAMAALRNPYLPEADKKIAEDIIKRAWDSAKPSEKIATLRALKADANDPRSLLEIEKDILRAGKTDVNILPGEKAQDVAVGKTLGEFHGSTIESALKVPANKANLDAAERAMNTPGFYSGAMSPAVTGAQRALVAMGIGDAKGASASELFQKLQNKTIMDSGGAGSGLGPQISNNDVRIIQNSSYNAENTPEGNRKIIAFQRLLEDRKVETSREMARYAKAHGGRIDFGITEHMAKWAEDHPLDFSKVPGLSQAERDVGKAAPAAQGGPEVGKVYYGRPYLGGDVSDPKSWGPRQ
jgi:hypothetical protein